MLKKLFTFQSVCYIPLWIILSLLGSVGCFYILNLGHSDTFFNSIVCKIFFALAITAALFITVKDFDKIKEKKALFKRIGYSFVFSALLASSYVMGYQLKVNEMTSLGVKGKLFIFLISCCLGIALLPLSNLWFRLMDRVKKSREKESVQISRKTSLKLFFISFGIIFVCWIPVFLAYYPAIMSYDFHRQSQEAYRGWMWFTSHHPLAHTALIRLFFTIGEAIGSYQIAMALFSIMQMLILSSVLAYSCTMITRLTGKKWPFWACTAMFGLLPIHPVMALSMTKDILFTAFVLLFVVLILEYRMAKTRKMRIFLYISLIITGMLVIIFRNNAIYALVLFTVFYVLISKKQRLAILILCIACIAGGSFAKTTMLKSMNAIEGSKIEMYSVFLQQMCRCGRYHELYLTEDEYNILSYYIPQEYWAGYNPIIADSLKSVIAVSTFAYWKEDIPQMLIDWATLGLAYPNDYIDAFLVQTQGYWFIDDMTHAEVLGYGEDTALGLLYTFNASVSAVFEGVESHSYFPWLLSVYNKIVNGNSYRYWPILSLLFKPAFYTWCLILCMMSAFYLKEKNKLVVYLFPFIYFLTLLLGPVVNFRYIYPIAVTIPYYFGWLFAKENWNSCYSSLPKQPKAEKKDNEIVSETN